MQALTRPITPLNPISGILHPAKWRQVCNAFCNGVLNRWHEARTRRTYDDPAVIHAAYFRLCDHRKPYTPKP